MAETETKRLITDLKQRIKARPTEDRQTDGKAKLLHCSFCGKSQHEVAKLIAGPKVYICDECVFLCIEILDDDAGPSV